MDKSVHTTLAFVHTYPNGEREFSFYRNPGADMMLKRDEVDADIIKNSKIFHFGTSSSTHDGVRSATRYAIDTAKNNGVFLSFDPNLRESLWVSPDDARREIKYGLSMCDILKISDNELEFMTGTNNYDTAVRILREKYNIPLMFVTLGADGSCAYYKDISAYAPSFSNVKTIEKTGAGDTFTGCMLSFLLDCGVEALSDEKLRELLIFANTGASLITARKGTLKVMPERVEIEALINEEYCKP